MPFEDAVLFKDAVTSHAPVQPEIVDLRAHGGRHCLVWRFPMSVWSLSSATVGGGLQQVSWLVNVEVDANYARTDLAAHAAELADALGLVGHGATMFTAANIRAGMSGAEAGNRVDATVGISKPTWAADQDGAVSPWSPGTINVVAQLPAALEPSAAVNAVMTITEAKSQALAEAGVPGTGTASDAVVVCWPLDGERRPFCGPRSQLGAPLARATHMAVAAGIERTLQ